MLLGMPLQTISVATATAQINATTGDKLQTLLFPITRCSRSRSCAMTSPPERAARGLPVTLKGHCPRSGHFTKTIRLDQTSKIASAQHVSPAHPEKQ